MQNGFANQDKRLIRLSTELPQDLLIPTRIAYNEVIGDGFTLLIDALSEQDHDILPETIVGTPITVAVVLSDNKFRYFNGVAQSFDITPATTRTMATKYHLRVTSYYQLLLSKRSNYRIFQDKSVPDVIRDVLAEYGSRLNFTIECRSSYEPWRYLVQHDETDLNFLNRLMSLVGLSFFFEHENGKHALFIFDDTSSLKDADPKTINIQQNTLAADSFSHWSKSTQFVAGIFESSTYNYLMPAADVSASKEAAGLPSRIPGVLDVSQYHYRGDYTSVAEAKAINDVRVKAESARVQQWNARGNIRHIYPAKNFSVALADGKPHPDDGQMFTPVKLSLTADDVKGELACQVTALTAGDMIYPVATRSQTNNLQTATVVGKSGQEVQTDNLGRIKVKFHWDRSNRSDGHNTCFLRVMQGFASNGFGSYFIPRVGDEVVVAFENGNPDRPFVVGSLYNAENSPPYADFDGLRSGFRTRSSKGGQADNCNELYFHDEKGKEEVYFQSEKDFNHYVKNDSSTKIDNNKSVQVLKNETHKIGENLTTEVGKVMIVNAKDSLSLQVGGSVIKITGSKIEISSSQVVINGSQVKLN